MRTIVSIGILVCVVAWLVLSYVPSSLVSLPTIAFDGAWAAAWFPVLAAATLIAMVGIQAWLVFATARLLRRPADAELAETIHQFGLRVRPEAFWTVLPLVMTLGLVLVSFASNR